MAVLVMATPRWSMKAEKLGLVQVFETMKPVSIAVVPPATLTLTVLV